MTNPYITQIDRLHTELEAMRQRAEAAEALLRGMCWEMKVAPLTLYQTRILRLLARADFSCPALIVGLSMDYPETTPDAVKVHICNIRRKLPAHIAPASDGRWNTVYRIPDRAALKAFLAGEMELMRAA